MSKLDVVLFSSFGLGFLLMFCSVIWMNVAVQRMRGVLNEGRLPQDQLQWSDAIQKVAQNVIDGYRKIYPDGPLYRDLVRGYYMFGIGVFLGIGSAFAMKFSN